MDLTEVSDELKQIVERRWLERRLRECLACMERETMLRGNTQESIAKYIIIEYLNHITILGKKLSPFEDLRKDVMEVFDSESKTNIIFPVIEKVFGQETTFLHVCGYIPDAPESFHIAFLASLMNGEGYHAIEMYRKGIEAFSSS